MFYMKLNPILIERAFNLISANYPELRWEKCYLNGSPAVRHYLNSSSVYIEMPIKLTGNEILLDDQQLFDSHIKPVIEKLLGVIHAKESSNTDTPSVRQVIQKDSQKKQTLKLKKTAIKS